MLLFPQTDQRTIKPRLTTEMVVVDPVVLYDLPVITFSIMELFPPRVEPVQKWPVVAADVLLSTSALVFPKEQWMLVQEITLVRWWKTPLQLLLILELYLSHMTT